MASRNSCPTCKTPSPSVSPKNLAVFIDGTSNKPGKKSTNVLKLSDDVKREPANDGSEPVQIASYLEGIGASNSDVDSSLLHRVARGFSRAMEMAFAWNVRRNVVEAYSWLVRNYQDGDHIYLFGFSRGAYQVRSLASMIHEVGLVRDEGKVNTAYRHYRSIDPYDDETRVDAIAFKKRSCWPGVRVHFVGVWDTVSSLGLIKEDVHITSSASVTNACHFRHALALDEHRVKFMPEHFTEVNALPGPRRHRGDVKEVWFPGSHSDVGGISRRQNQMCFSEMETDTLPHPVHAGNVSFEWMKREATAHGLVFKTGMPTWDSEDVDLGREDTMTIWWKILEVFPIRQQVSFSGTGEHATRLHRFRPRSILPSQQIHTSVLSGDVYIPHAVLGGQVDIPAARHGTMGRLWATAREDEGTMSQLSELLSDQQKTLGNLEKVLFLLDRVLVMRPSPAVLIPSPLWSQTIGQQSGLDKFVLAVIADVIPSVILSEELREDAREALSVVLLSPKSYPTGLFSAVRFATKHRDLRQRFIAHNGVVSALMVALEWTAEYAKDNSFPLVMDSLCHLINNHLDDPILDVAGQLSTRFSIILEVKEPTHLVASLRVITCLTGKQHPPRGKLKDRVIALTKESHPVGPAALETLVALRMPLDRSIPITNILGYLGRILPPLDAEVGSLSSPNNISDSDVPYALRVSGSGALDEGVMLRLLSAIESRDVHARFAATLTLLKLCRNQAIRHFCLQHQILDVFTKQLKAKRTCLLAAYALKACIEQGITQFKFDDVAKHIRTMLSKGWFDDVVGQLEGFEVFHQLILISRDINQRIVSPEVIDAMVEKLGDANRHEVRACLLCLDLFAGCPDLVTRLTSHMTTCITNLSANNRDTRGRSANILSELAQTRPGEEAILPLLAGIVRLLPRSPADLSTSKSNDLITVVRNLCRNETLRRSIRTSNEFCAWNREYSRAAPR